MQVEEVKPMKPASDAVFEIVTNHPILHFGMVFRLLNLSHVAKFIHTAVEAQTRREVTHAAVLMALSRMQSKVGEKKALDELELDKINIKSGICYFMVPKTKTTQLEIAKLTVKVLEKNGFITVSQALNEVSVCLDGSFFELAKKTLSVEPREVDFDLAALELTFAEPKCGDPGTMYQILEQVALHNINLVSVGTASCELSMFMTEEDASTAYNALYQRFIKKAGKKARSKG